VLASELLDDEGLLDTLADRLADRLAARLSAVEPPPALVDAREVAQRTGKTRRWFYDHSRELGAVPLGSGPRSRLGFPADVIAQLKLLSTATRWLHLTGSPQGRSTTVD
jgi:predicted DNA-binding transcriptional regulator AlpA